MLILYELQIIEINVDKDEKYDIDQIPKQEFRLKTKHQKNKQIKMLQRIFSQSPPKPTDDPLDRLLGHFGIWQFLVVSTVSLVKLSSGWVQMAILFLTPSVTFWCSDTNSSLSIGDYVNNTDVEDSGSIGTNNTCYESCERYEYDGVMQTTIISEWDLICERRWLASFTQMILQLGVLIGSIIFGFLSDRYGRKYAFLLSITTLIAFGFGVPYSPNYTVFTIIRFFLGMATAGTMVVSFVIVMETVGSRYRGVVGCLFQIPFIIGHMTVPLFAFYFRTWDSYSLALAIPPVIYLGYFFMLSESPRWLVSKGRVAEAAVIVKKAAMINHLPTSSIEETLQKLSTEISSPSSDRQLNYQDLFGSSLRLKTACTCFMWLIVGLTFFGLNQYIGQTSPDPFVSVAVAGAIQIPSNFLAMWLISHFGRKVTTASFFCFGGLCIITLGCVPDLFWLTLTLGSLGVSCASIVATTIYIYTSELYPTVVRNMAMGACSMSMRVGSMVAPFISNLTVTVPWLPTVIFGVAPIVAGLVCLCLPETKGKALADSMEDLKKDSS